MVGVWNPRKKNLFLLGDSLHFMVSSSLIRLDLIMETHLIFSMGEDLPVSLFDFLFCFQ